MKVNFSNSIIFFRDTQITICSYIIQPYHWAKLPQKEFGLYACYLIIIFSLKIL